MDNLKGRLTISRPQGGTEGTVRVRVMDADANATAVEVEIPLADFADCLFGHGDVPCRFSFNDSGVVGTVREYKQELVYVPPLTFTKKDAANIAKALARHEVDGWEGCVEDARNPHRCRPDAPLPKGKKGGVMMEVVFERWVPRPKLTSTPAPQRATAADRTTQEDRNGLTMPRYCVTTWDAELQKFTEQSGVPCRHLPQWMLRRALRLLRHWGYPATRDDHAVFVRQDYYPLVVKEGQP